MSQILFSFFVFPRGIHGLCSVCVCVCVCGVVIIVIETESNTEDNQVSRSAKTVFAPVVLIALGAVVAVVVMRTAHRAESTVMLSNGQKLFTLNDFDSGRVSYPSQNLANGQGQITPPALGGADHSHVFWSNGTFTPVRIASSRGHHA